MKKVLIIAYLLICNNLLFSQIYEGENPCDDIIFILLEERGIDGLSDRESEYYKIQSKKCSEYKELIIKSSNKKIDKTSIVTPYMNKEKIDIPPTTIPYIGNDKIDTTSTTIPYINNKKINNTSVMMPYKPEIHIIDIKKKALYIAGRKNPSLAGVSALLLPTSGHAYAGRWSRGLPFLLFQLLGLSMILDTQTETVYYNYGGGVRYSREVPQEGNNEIGAMCYMAATLFSIIDANRTANEYNKKLYENIYDMEPPPYYDDSLKNTKFSH